MAKRVRRGSNPLCSCRGLLFINASRLIRDPMSRLKQDNPRLWLELYWIASGPH
ncbi:MAG: hypothetical protein F6K35_36015 [Okeania sp. SIO2H7]|nr:hypothetical protein [Okeania sp. SIO2H7]